MIAPEIVSTLQLGHALANGALFLGCLLQGLLGWRIRRRRVAAAQPDFSIVKKHRKRGPVLAALLPLGYLVGLVTVYLRKGLWVLHPLHLAVGTVLLIVLFSAVAVSTRIRGAQSPWRTVHAVLGLLLLCVFLTQLFTGLNILL